MPTYTNELATTVKSLFDEGNIDPTAKEIAQRHLGRKVLGRKTIEEIQEMLPKIRGAIEREYGIQSYLVNEPYYELREMPATLTEARKLIPNSPGIFTNSFGLRKLNGGHDTLWEATVKHNLSKGSGALKAGFNRTIDACENHQRSDNKAEQNMRMALRESRPLGVPERYRHLIEPPTA